MNNGKSISTNGIYAVLAKIFGMLVPFVVMPFILRTLGAESYGKVIYVQSLVAYFTLACTLGINDFALRECSVIRENRIELQKKVSQIFTISIILTALSLIAFFSYILIVKDARNEYPLYLIFSLSIVCSGLLMDWIFWVNERFDSIAKRDVIGKVFYLVLCFLLVSSPNDFLLYAAVLVFSYNLIPFFLNHYNIWKGRCGVKVGLRVDSDFKQNLKAISFLGLMTLGSKLFSSCDIILTKWLSPVDGNVSVGLYNSGIILPLVIEQLLFVIVSVVSPKLYTYLGQHNESQAQILSNTVSDVMYFVVVPAVLTCLFFSKELLFILGGSEYLPATRVLQIYSLMLITSVAITLAGTRAYVARRKEKKLSIIIICMAFFNITLDFLLIPRWGIEGAAVATVIANTVLMIVELTLEKSWNLVFSKSKIRYVVGAFMLSVVFFIVQQYFTDASILMKSLILLVAGVLYIILMYMLKETTMLLLQNKIHQVISSIFNSL